MASTISHICIKKKYATGIINDFKKMEAVELPEASPIPEWQKKEVKRRLKEMQKDPSKLIGWSEGMKKIKQLGK